MIENADQDLKKVFEDIASALKCETPSDAVYLLKEMNRELFRKESVSVNSEDIPLLAGSVNVTRLKNNPVKLGEETLTMLYAGILGELTFSERNGGIGKKVMSFLDKCFSNYTLPPEAIAFGNLADR